MRDPYVRGSYVGGGGQAALVTKGLLVTALGDSTVHSIVHLGEFECIRSRAAVCRDSPLRIRGPLFGLPNVFLTIAAGVLHTTCASPLHTRHTDKVVTSLAERILKWGQERAWLIEVANTSARACRSVAVLDTGMLLILPY